MRNERFQEEWNEYTCRSGLNVVLIRKPQFCTSAALLMTPFGSLDQMQTDDGGERITHELGTAHFLEHKLFESDQDDVMRLFSRFGANVNAYTTYDSTVYYFTTPSEDLSAPLTLLLDFVQDLSITEASVEKEKPIILEELATYQQDPDARLFLESMRAVYRRHPLRTDIVGNQESIMRITPDGLQEAYRRNYHPSNMTLIVVSSKSDQEIMDICEGNQAAKTFAQAGAMKRFILPEGRGVYRTFQEYQMDIEQPKCSVTIKLPASGTSAFRRIRSEWALRFSLERQFTAMNPVYQSWLDQQVITPYFGYEVEYSDDYAFIYFEDVSDQSERLRDFVLEQTELLKQNGIREEETVQMKRRVIGASLRSFDHPMDMASAWGRGILREMNQFDECELIESIDPDVCMDVLKMIDTSVNSCVKLAPQE